MDQLDDHGQIDMAVTRIAQSLRAQQGQDRAQSFAAASDHIVTNLVDQRHVGMQALAHQRIDRPHLGGD